MYTPKFNSFGTSFAPAIGPSAAQLRARADADAEQARRDALPPAASTWLNILNFAELETWAVVSRMYAAAGGAAVIVPRADLAAHLHTTPEDAAALLDALVAKGALDRTNQLNADAVYRPITTPPAWLSTKGDRVTAARSGKRREADASRLAAGLGIRPR